MDPNLTYPIILNQTLNATINATLYEPVHGFEEWFKPSSLLGLGQISTAFALIYITYENFKLSKNQANLEAKKRKYNLLREEMNKLIGPLYKAYRSTQAIRNSWGFFEPLDQRNRGIKEWEDYFQLWDGIRSNAYLSQSKELRKSINKYLFENDNLFIFGGKETNKRFLKVRLELLQVIKKRYPDLIKEIDHAEDEILSAEITAQQSMVKSWWQFWR